MTINLKNWKMHLPIDSKGTKKGSAWQITNLIGFNYSPYFIQNNDGSLTFSAPVDGAKTSSNTKYARSELREMKLTSNGSQGSEADWQLKTGGTMNVSLQVDRVPTLKGGKPGHIVIGQIHGASDELVRLYREGDGTINFHCDKAGPKNKELVYQPIDANGNKPNVSLGERFSYHINATATKVNVQVVADGKTYSVSFTPNSVWAKDKFYFKAGIYLGVNASQGTGDGQVKIYDVTVSH